MELISKPVDPDTLHAVMQVCVRFTRDYENARLIADMNAVQRLLQLRQVSSFTGFVGLSTMLIRHVLEEPANITAAIERVSYNAYYLVCISVVFFIIFNWHA